MIRQPWIQKDPLGTAGGVNVSVVVIRWLGDRLSSLGPPPRHCYCQWNHHPAELAVGEPLPHLAAAFARPSPRQYPAIGRYW
jgi:hypothetical protein